jgi:hypothetical protein
MNAKNFGSEGIRELAEASYQLSHASSQLLGLPIYQRPILEQREISNGTSRRIVESVRMTDGLMYWVTGYQ